VALAVVWMAGWAVAVAAGAMALLVMELTASPIVSVAVFAAGAAAGMSVAAFRTAERRWPGVAGEPAWQAGAWTLAAVAAFLSFVLSWSPPDRLAQPGDVNAVAAADLDRGQAGPSGPRLPEAYVRVLRLLATFGTAGGLLSVLAASRRRLRVVDVWRGILAGGLWGLLVMVCGVAAFYGVYFGLAQGPTGLVVGTAIAGGVTGLILGALGEAVNRLSLGLPA